MKDNQRFLAKLCNFLCNNLRQLLKPLGQLFGDHPNYDEDEDDHDNDDDDDDEIVDDDVDHNDEDHGHIVNNRIGDDGDRSVTWIDPN